jgi:hypothetical protein
VVEDELSLVVLVFVAAEARRTTCPIFEISFHITS